MIFLHWGLTATRYWTFCWKWSGFPCQTTCENLWAANTPWAGMFSCCYPCRSLSKGGICWLKEGYRTFSTDRKSKKEMTRRRIEPVANSEFFESYHTSSTVPGSSLYSSAFPSLFSSYLLVCISALSRQGRTKPPLKPVFFNWRIGRVNKIVLLPPWLGVGCSRFDFFSHHFLSFSFSGQVWPYIALVQFWCYV